MPTIVHRQARAEDWPAVRALLEACDLPLAGAREALSAFWLMCHTDAGLVGCAALERYGRRGCCGRSPSRRGGADICLRVPWWRTC